MKQVISPQAILNDLNLSNNDKIARLKDMLLDEKLKIVASEENMPNKLNEDSDIVADIITCLEKLGYQFDEAL